MTVPNTTEERALRVQESLFTGERDKHSSNGDHRAIERYEYDRDEEVLVRITRTRDGGESETLVPVEDGDVSEKDDLGTLFDQLWLRSRVRPLRAKLQDDVRVADLFSGCGGMTLGVWEACRALGLKMTPVIAVDSDTTALKVFKDNFDPDEVDDSEVE